MALPTSGNLSVRDVGAELSLLGTYSLADCFAASWASGFNPTYGTITDTNLRAFLGYSHILLSTSLTYDVSSSATSCANFPSTYYTDSGNLSTCSYISATSSGGPAISGYYSDQTNWRFWNSSSETFTSSGSC